MSKRSVYIIGSLGYSKVCGHWVPHSLTNYHKTVRREACSDLLTCYKAEGKTFILYSLFFILYSLFFIFYSLFFHSVHPVTNMTGHIKLSLNSLHYIKTFIHSIHNKGTCNTFTLIVELSNIEYN